MTPVTLPPPDTIELPVAFLNALSEADAVETVLARACDWLLPMMRADRVSCYFMQGDAGDGRPEVRAEAWPESWPETWRGSQSAVRWSGGHRDPSDATVLAQLDRTARTARLADGQVLMFQANALLASDHPLHPELYDAGLRVLVLAPMVNAGRTVGLITIGARDADALTATDGRRLAVIAKTVAAQLMLMHQHRAAARLAETDPLTGVANRARLMRVLSGGGGRLAQPDARGRHLGVLHIDLDRFKEVNDQLGHGAGDRVLCHAAQTMLTTTGAHDLVARMGGDEFVIVTRTDPTGQHLMHLGQRLIAALSRPMELDGQEVRIGASIGAAVARDRATDADRLIADADLALYQVKRAGRGAVRLYDRAMRKVRATPTPRTGVSLVHLVVHGELLATPHDLRPAWLRVRPPGRPSDVGWSREVGHLLLRRGLDALTPARRATGADLRLMVPASGAALAARDMVPSILANAHAARLEPSDLMLEVPATDLSRLGSDRAIRALADMRDAGLAVSLGGIDADVLRLQALAEAAITAVRLDPLIVALMPDPRAEAVLRAAITLARDLSLRTIAGGVDTADQAARLARLGCNYVSGDAVAAPMMLDGQIATGPAFVPPATRLSGTGHQTTRDVARDTANRPPVRP